VCTSQTPTRRRGPPKGQENRIPAFFSEPDFDDQRHRYLNLVETRVHGLEAIIGVLLSSPNPAMRGTLDTLSEDPFASTVLLRVANGSYGPRALAKFNTQRRVNGPSSPNDRTYYTVFLSCFCVTYTCTGQRSPEGAATNEWQLQAIQTMIANSSSGNLPP
jgi:hypothetical protein